MTTTKSMLEETPKTIRVSFKTYRDLAQLGTFGDSFDSIITDLLSDHEKSVRKGEVDQTSPSSNPDQNTRRQSFTPRPSGANRYDY